MKVYFGKGGNVLWVRFRMYSCMGNGEEVEFKNKVVYFIDAGYESIVFFLDRFEVRKYELYVFIKMFYVKFKE